MDYKPGNIEAKWRQKWKDAQIYKVEIDNSKPKYYVLDMFPYPSGAGLHVGHPLGYIATDIFSRYKRHKGYNVLHPMGYDAFGLPAEQYAIQTGVNPKVSTEINVTRYREQLENLGFSYDWSREVKTSDPSYYKWTQWIFLKLFDHYYDIKENKAKPISELENYFEINGAAGNTANNSLHNSFSAAEWKAFSPKEKNDILMHFRLAYKGVAYVNWCEALGTVLANDEVKDGFSERGGHPVVKRPMENWFLRITAYADRLLHEMENLEWSDALKAMQENWIGRSEGAQVFFKLEHSEDSIEIFTTRPDTIFGVSFMVLAPEHEMVNALTTGEQSKQVNDYINYVKTRSERERMSETKQVSGAFTGSYAVHPFTGDKIPVWISEYVLKDYGTGAIMAVPAGDLRDMAFARKFSLPIPQIIDQSGIEGAEIEDKVGILINSDFLNGLEVKAAIKLAIEKINELKIGKRRVNYKLRDANFSRQRYWGEPFPITYDNAGVALPLKENELPLTLPDLDDFKPGTGGQSPLARVSEWVNLPDGTRRETDTMPGFAGSSWYFLRYMDAHNEQEFAGTEALKYWQDVDLYVGGTEHAVGHLMYSRFWHKFLYDLGLVPTIEPFKKLINQGMITAIGTYYIVNENEKITSVRLPYSTNFLDKNGNISKDEYAKYYTQFSPQFSNIPAINQIKWLRSEDNSYDYIPIEKVHEKMSKSKFNVVNPDELIEQYGCDCFRMYEMFLGPIEDSKPWNTQGIDGVAKFIRKLWSLFFNDQGLIELSQSNPTKEELKILHQCIKKVCDDIERFSFNTCVSSFMICVNELKRINSSNYKILKELVILLSPFAPHTCEELWEKIGLEFSVITQPYPSYNPSYLVEDTIEYPICINGKKRALIELPNGIDSDTAKERALELPEIIKWLEGNEPNKVIVIPGKMINLVI